MQPIIFDITGEYLTASSIWFVGVVACYVVAVALVILLRRG